MSVRVDLNNRFLEGDVGFDITAKMVQVELDAAKGKDITFSLNSYGGDAFTGTSIAEIVRNYSGNVTFDIVGLAASAGSVATTTAEKVRIAKSGMYMLHAPKSGAYGEANELRQSANLLDKLNENIIDLYAGKASGVERDEVSRLVADTTWLTAEEAVKLGFADEIIDEELPINSAGLDKYNYDNVPAFLRQTKKDDKMDKIILSTLGVSDESEVLAKVQALANEAETSKGVIAKLEADIEAAKKDKSGIEQELKLAKESVKGEFKLKDELILELQSKQAVQEAALEALQLKAVENEVQELVQAGHNKGLCAKLLATYKEEGRAKYNFALSIVETIKPENAHLLGKDAAGSGSAGLELEDEDAAFEAKVNARAKKDNISILEAYDIVNAELADKENG